MQMNTKRPRLWRIPSILLKVIHYQLIVLKKKQQSAYNDDTN